MSLREKLLRVAPEAWEDEFVRIRPMATRDDLIYAGDGCRLTDEQREFVNPVWFSLGRAYLAPEDHDPCLIENERREPIGFLCFTAWADAYSWTSGSRGGATESGRRSWRSACSGWPIRICRSSWPWRLPTHGRRDFTARWASGSCRSGTATIWYTQLVKEALLDFFAKLLRPLRGLAMTIRGHFRSVIMPSNLQLPKALTERRHDLIWNFPQQKVGKKAGPGLCRVRRFTIQ